MDKLNTFIGKGLTTIGARVITNMLYCKQHNLQVPLLPVPLNSIVKHEATTIRTPLYAKRLTDEYLEHNILETSGLNLMEYIELPKYMKQILKDSHVATEEMRKAHIRRSKQEASDL